MNRAAWLAGGGSAALAASARSAAVGQTLRDVTMTNLAPSATSYPALIAAELGFYKRYGLNYNEVKISSTAAGAQLLIAKGCDFTGMSVTQLIESVQGGAPIKAVVAVSTTAPYTLVGGKGIKKASDVVGKSICVGGVNDFTRIFAERILEAGGVKPSQYDETYAGATTDRRRGARLHLLDLDRRRRCRCCRRGGSR